ncbi:putative endo-xylogalacturonan hydrolase A [Colletotrichum chlorophyti]|uniref:Putative endo-xylogalacturonan hydrolase A n=1 Tax=Colletotrichum chlorophyti TaxID=708187 RepID=A0A1Q8RBM7_9PEZI|nr:putative endo-xylogalacturonan hydrolase A [Colletotrichum chlorophyti]
MFLNPLPLLPFAIALFPRSVIAGPTPAYDLPPSSIEQRAATCTPSSAGRASVDDVPAIKDAFKQCGNGGVIVFPQDVTYMVRSQLDFTGCANCEVRFDGRLKVSDDIAFWNNTRYMVQLRGIRGARLHSPLGTGELDGNGQAAWDRIGTHDDMRRPALFVVENSTDISVGNLYFKNAPNVFVYIGTKSARLSFQDMRLTAISKTQYRPRHTDGFDIGESEHTTLSNIYIQNGDDCVAFKPGCNYVSVTNITCQGSHGLSVGSLGKSPKAVDAVQNVYVKNAIMRGATKAAGIKIYPGGSNYGRAVVRNVTWDGVEVDNSDAAFQFDTCYNADEAYCKANPSTAEVTEIYIKNFSGQTSTRYSPTTGYIYCPAESDKCQLRVDNWNVKSGTADGRLQCNNISSNVLGTQCVKTDPWK